MTAELMTTRELAAYLRIKDRTVYDMVAKREIPCTRVAGKWLFPRELIDAWLAAHTEGPKVEPGLADAPAILAGSHDPLLEWAVRSSGSGLGLLFDGSLDGLERFARGEAVACGMHVIEGEEGGYNVQTARSRLGSEPVVLMEWAKREQGLIVPRGNPQHISSVTDLPGKRFAFRQWQAGSTVLLERLCAAAGVDLDDIGQGALARNETEVALAVLDGRADAGLAVASVARQFRLDYIPIATERYDLLLYRRDWFEAPLQTLSGVFGSDALLSKAEAMGGYDLRENGRIRYNAV